MSHTFLTRFFNTPKKILITLLVISAILRFYKIDYPNTYVFDEVYHGFTAKEYAKNNKDAWNPWAKSPPGVAYEWLHPPISKEIMALSLIIFKTTDPWGWRIPGVFFGVLSIFLVYKIALLLFKKELPALLGAFIFSMDGLLFVQSRTGMNDAYLVTFILASLLFFLKKSYFLSALFLGLSIATKWPGIFLIPIYEFLLLKDKNYRKIPLFIVIPGIIYLLSYTPYFLHGYKWSDFIELHNQIWWYQTNLKATHDYASPWWSWPLNLYPVWYYVEYLPSGKISNIFASGNLILYIFGLISLALTLIEGLKKKSRSLLIIIAGYLIFLAPWAFSPRIMFIYHYSPCIPFLSLALGYQISKFRNPSLKILILSLVAIGFILIYPILVGIPLDKSILKFFFMTNITKNPFGN